MIGSHNTMSYLPAVHWWQRWMKRWYCCQSKTLQEQYESGARYFDIRLKLINDEWHFVHNHIDFGIEDNKVYQWMDSLDDQAIVRFMLDVRKKPKNEKEYIDKFLTHIKVLTDIHHNILVDSIIVYWDWKEYAVSGYVDEVHEIHASVCNTKLDYLLYGTKVCRPLFNDNLIKTISYCDGNSNAVILEDFV